MGKYEARTTQSQHPWRATARTIFAVVTALAAMAPVIYTAATQQSPELATGAIATALAITASITRILALPVVESFLQRFVPWLAAGINRGDTPDGNIRVIGDVELAAMHETATPESNDAGRGATRQSDG